MIGFEVPQCFERSGSFDRDEVEAFFAGRRDAILDQKALPLTPLSKLPAFVQARWRQYLAEKAAREHPMNGVAA
jgi:hypothetical protein